MLLNQQHTYLEPLSSRKQQLGLDVVLLTLLARQGEKARRVVHVGSLVASAAEPSAVLRDVFLRVDMGISIFCNIVSSHEVLAGGCFRWVLAPVRDLVARLLLACRWGFRCPTFELQRLVD